MTKHTKTITFEIDGKKVKYIPKYDKEGNEIWAKFKPLETQGLDKGLHFVHKKPEENHFDIYLNGNEINKDRTRQIRSAGVAIVFGNEKRFVTLPPIEVTDEDFNKERSPIEKAESYVKRVRILDSEK
jgi:hypothetical protein